MPKNANWNWVRSFKFILIKRALIIFMIVMPVFVKDVMALGLGDLDPDGTQTAWMPDPNKRFAYYKDAKRAPPYAGNPWDCRNVHLSLDASGIRCGNESKGHRAHRDVGRIPRRRTLVLKHQMTQGWFGRFTRL